MTRGHTPYGYRIVDGRPEICEEEAERLVILFKSFASGRSYINAASDAGLNMTHSSSKNILRNSIYKGDGRYQRIIDDELFHKVSGEIAKREKRIGDRNARTYLSPKAETRFIMRKGKDYPDNPFRRAEYLYGLIESEDETDAKCKEHHNNTRSKEKCKEGRRQKRS